ncbi:S-layer homology domain-containing protein [Aureibacillus halotolerans]|uniref:S-layer family protein n=1 Tax=Aureibacillus halotolerans TaxID=1508390 RepID=A0A4R6TRE2_9BACI|nr:S-layer homology domain-containing protein [Aureibacillus halotolerans]TDQ36130.1 S-layer family protein [Aureibacillus halotolerans]
MQKVPLSKKAMTAMIAAAVTLAPATAIVQPVSAAESSDISQAEYNKLEKILDNVSQKGKQAYERAAAVISDFGAEEWNAILAGTNVDELSDNQLSSLAEDFILLFYPTTSGSVDLEDRVKEFRDQWDDEFNKVFGTDVTVELIVDFVAAMEDEAISNKQKYIGDLLNDSFEETLRKVKNEVIENNPDFQNLNDDLREGLGVDVDGLFDIKRLVDEQLVENGLDEDDIDLMRSSLATALMETYLSNDNDNDNGNDDDDDDNDNDSDNDDNDDNGSSGGGGSSSGGGGSSSDTDVDVDGATVTVPEDAQTRETVGNTTIVTLDTDDLIEALDDSENFKTLVVDLSLEDGQSKGTLQVTGELIQALADLNPDAAVIQVETADATYLLPVNEIDLDELALAFGVDASDVEISISIGYPTVATSYTFVAPVVDFTVTASANGEELSWDFDGYVDRIISLDRDVDASIATGVRLGVGNSISFVPSVFSDNEVMIRSKSNSAYSVIEQRETFSDIEGHWNEIVIEEMASKQIIAGMTDTTFAPDQPTTRAQLAVLLTRSLGLEAWDTRTDNFKDVSGDEWFVTGLDAAVRTGIITGYEDSTFRPNEQVTREEAAVMISRALSYVGYDEEKLNDAVSATTFGDYANVGAWAQADLDLAVQAGILGGFPDGTFAPQEDTERDEIASILKRFLSFVNFIN